MDGEGWFTERHPKLDPVATMTDGIFITGAAQGPKDIPATVAQGAAAAARVQGMITKGTVEIEPIVATIIEEKCSGCRICNTLCPFNAIEMKTHLNGCLVANVNMVQCKGCGCCVAACLSKAMQQRGFTDRQVLRMIEACGRWVD